MLSKSLTFCATGHRPDKLGGYTQAVHNKLLDVALSIINDFVKPDETIISGMALGWDLAIAQAAYLTSRHLVAAVPFKGQELRWPEYAQTMYRETLACASEIETISAGGYSAYKMQLRNEWMIDRSDVVLSLWNGDNHGGTYNCLQYADKRGVREVACWSYYNAWELL